MASSFEKSVKGATKIKAAPPKTKYIEHILVATHSGEAGVGEVFRALQGRLRDSTWTIVFKSLITIHLMIREGQPDSTLSYLAKHRNLLAISSFTDAQTQGRNIRHYASYLAERVRAYRDTKCDWVRVKEGRLEKMTVEKGLLRETEVVQHQLTALLKCDVMEADPENEVTIFVFRLLVLDLLALFQVLNQGLINILGHFFEMSKPDAERAMAVYRTFTKQTDYVVHYLGTARQFEHLTRVEVPKLKHAPVHLGRQLEEYLRDPDFEINRRQYIAELDAKKKSGNTSAVGISRLKADASPLPSNSRSAAASASVTTTNGHSQQPQAAAAASTTKGPDPDLIDFFDSIEQNQTQVTVEANPQQTSTVYAQNAAFQPQATGFPANGFVAPQATGFGTNPFQQQQLQQQQLQLQQQQLQQQQQQLQQQQTGFGPFGNPAPQLQPVYTGAAPSFAGFPQQQPSFQPSTLGSIPQNSIATFPTSSAGLQPMQTGTTNPFRQSMLLHQATGFPGIAPAAAASPTSPTLNRQSTNPFARISPSATQPAPASASSNQAVFAGQQQQQQAIAAAPAPLQPMATGTNPFARPMATGAPQPVPPSVSTLAPQPTGSTNPFRSAAFVNQSTGLGWQHTQTPIGGGLDQLETVPVFPRPAQQTPWQQ